MGLLAHMSWTRSFLIFQRNISSTTRATRAYERRSTWWILCLVFEPGLPGMNSSIRKGGLRYYRGITAVLANRR